MTTFEPVSDIILRNPDLVTCAHTTSLNTYYPPKPQEQRVYTASVHNSLHAHCRPLRNGPCTCQPPLLPPGTIYQTRGLGANYIVQVPPSESLATALFYYINALSQIIVRHPQDILETPSQVSNMALSMQQLTLRSLVSRPVQNTNVPPTDTTCSATENPCNS